MYWYVNYLFFIIYPRINCIQMKDKTMVTGACDYIGSHTAIELI
jgi:hypothetical protein